MNSNLLESSRQTLANLFASGSFAKNNPYFDSPTLKSLQQVALGEIKMSDLPIKTQKLIRETPWMVVEDVEGKATGVPGVGVRDTATPGSGSSGSLVSVSAAAIELLDDGNGLLPMTTLKVGGRSHVFPVVALTSTVFRPDQNPFSFAFSSTSSSSSTSVSSSSSSSCFDSNPSSSSSSSAAEVTELKREKKRLKNENKKLKREIKKLKEKNPSLEAREDEREEEEEEEGKEDKLLPEVH